ncbi:NAD(P)-binding domain-containing protein [Gemmatimonas sp.]|uniref:NADPH-dependent F420 reductase n=1 Tax=Gemmatimonas sp. TaxID=1962908 RepID=UPI00286EB1F4|nr:NAD(P)-binding domain-containing protein [Gemmatimonas sp.]
MPTRLRMRRPRQFRDIVLAALAIASACGTPPADKAPAEKAPAENPPAPVAEKGVVAIIGTGTLAGALGPALGSHGYRVIYGSRDPGRDVVRALVQKSGPNASAVSQREAASRAPVVVLAVPGEVVVDVAGTLGDLSGKVVIDVSGGDKKLAPDGYQELTSDSAKAERIQSRHLTMRVVRINLPNIVYFMDPLLTKMRATVFVAGNDPQARETVANMIFDLGVDPWDAGPLRFARLFDAFNTLANVPGQQRRAEGYQVVMMPTVPFSCFFDMVQYFKFGEPTELKQLPKFPRREPAPTCEQWLRRLPPMGPQSP